MHSDCGKDFMFWGVSEDIIQRELTASLGSVSDCSEDAVPETLGAHEDRTAGP